MATKRAADQAFAHDGDLVTAPSGCGAPAPQVHKYANVSPSKLPVPGNWPSNDDPLSDIEKDAPARTSFLTKMGRWALAKAVGFFQYIRPQQVIVQPIVRKDGARKKRIIDAGLADEPAVTAAGLTDAPPTPVLITRATVFPRTRVFKRGRGRGRNNTLMVVLPLPAPAAAPAPAPVYEHAPAPIAEILSTTSPSKVAQGIEQLEHDDSLDFSFSDVVGSSTPPRYTVTAPVVHIAATKVYQNQAPEATQGARPRSKSIDDISPNSRLNIIHNSSATPIRKSLLKKHVYTYQRETEARKNSFTEAAHAPTNEGPTAEDAYQACYNHVETVDQDLSDLPDAPPPEGFVEETDPNYVLKPRVRKSVQWSETAHAKPFYCDEAACDMLDTTIETIKGSPSRPVYRDGEQHDDSDDDASSGQGSPQQSAAVPFTGVPESTWEDSEQSLSELQLSEELLSGLRLEVSAAPSPSPSPPPAPPQIKKLVTPLSSDEQNKIKAVAVASSDGKDKQYEIIQHKVTAHDFSTLLPRQFNGDPRAWLNDSIVNEYLAMLTAEAKKRAGFQKSSGSAPPVHVFSSFFYTTLRKRPAGVARWAGKVGLAGKQYLDAELVLYPICHNGHWRLLAVKPKDRTIEYLDSMDLPGSEFIKDIKGYLARELQDAWVENEWTVLKEQRSTQQENGSDCGVFTILNALALMQEEEAIAVHASDGMLDARERIAATLLAGAPTTEFT
ncbi:hypothetical protein DE146DRAFT_697334 [Phaeosphaeria sp. MPI-PUGE-AT-0046c]|nr:hypothetical protein DE146DRAFT_697334 [Phaeosphaeria sp. MPI-PUGE-AT-0046c]